MRKILSLVLCLLMLVAVFAGCSKTAEEPAKTEETKTTEPAESKEPEGGKTEGTPVGNGTLTLTEDPVEITVWMPYNDVSDTEEMKLSPYPGIIEDFEEKYPNVTIIFEGLGADSGEYQAALSLSAASNNFPELVYNVNGQLMLWQDSGVVIDYAPYLSDDYYAAFNDSVVENANLFAKKEGAVYVTAVCEEVEGWLFNMKILEEYDLEEPETWDELLNVCSVLSANGVLPIAQGGADSWAIWGYHEWPFQYGFSVEQAQQYEAGEITTKESAFFQQFQKIYELAQAGGFSPDCATTKFDTAGALFLEGNAAMFHVYNGWHVSQMRQYLSDPEAYASIYEVLMESVFSYGFEFDDDIYEDGEHHGIKMDNWGFYIGSCAEKDPQKLAAAVAFLEFMVTEEEYYNFTLGGVDNAVFVWKGEDTIDISDFGMQKSYQEAYALEGEWHCEPSDYFQKSIVTDYRNVVTGLCCGMTVEDALATFDAWQVTNAAS